MSLEKPSGAKWVLWPVPVVETILLGYIIVLTGLVIILIALVFYLLSAPERNPTQTGTAG